MGGKGSSLVITCRTKEVGVGVWERAIADTKFASPDLLLLLNPKPCSISCAPFHESFCSRSWMHFNEMTPL